MYQAPKKIGGRKSKLKNNKSTIGQYNRGCPNIESALTITIRSRSRSGGGGLVMAFTTNGPKEILRERDECMVRGR
jgi:hypothetical protein